MPKMKLPDRWECDDSGAAVCTCDDTSRVRVKHGILGPDIERDMTAEFKMPFRTNPVTRKLLRIVLSSTQQTSHA